MKFRLPSLLILITVMGFFTGVTEPGVSQETENYVFNRKPLKEQPYKLLPVGNVKPQGWLLNEMEKQAEGITKKLPEIYPNVGKNNAWRGGNGDVWERGPYWLDGAVPMAYILGDEELKKEIKAFIEWTLNSQQENGFFGPAPKEDIEQEPGLQKSNRADWWPRMVMLKVLQSYYTATKDERVLDFMTDYFKYQQKMLPEQPLNHWTHWSKSRGGENQLSIYWLYNRTGDEFLLDLAQTVYEQTRDWTDIFLRDEFRTHGVNTAMALKQPVVNYLQTRNERNMKAFERGLEYLMDEHGQVQGMFSGDELLHGTAATHGTELCTVVEFMYSLEQLSTMTGRVNLMDHLEKVAYNALPAQVKDDYSSRQYFQQPNQIKVSKEENKERNFMTNHDGQCNLFGLVNGYPCCTTNMHQGWPKYVRSMWVASEDNGLAAMLYGPNTVTAKVADGRQVTITQNTDYPFEETIRFEISTEKPVIFPLHLRIPEWTQGASLSVNGKEYSSPQAGTMHVLEQEWENGDVVELKLPMKVNLSRWHERSIGVERGPLVYALQVDGKWKKINSEYGVPVWEKQPQEDWNYGIVAAGKDPQKIFEVEASSMTENPWSEQGAPIKLTVNGKKIPTWKEYNESAGPLPYSPARTDQEAEKITLIPYGSTVLRISEFPVVRD